jgi:hypothetical protein
MGILRDRMIEEMKLRSSRGEESYCIGKFLICVKYKVALIAAKELGIFKEERQQAEQRIAICRNSHIRGRCIIFATTIQELFSTLGLSLISINLSIPFTLPKVPGLAIAS